MKFGEFEKLMATAELAMKVAGESSYETPQRYNKTEPMFPKKPMVESKNQRENVDFDSLIGDITSILNENEDVPQPRPAVSQKDFVAKATGAQKAGSQENVTNKKLEKQPSADMFSTSDDANGQLAVKGDKFKKFITENFQTKDNVKMIECINRVFDTIVLGKS